MYYSHPYAHSMEMSRAFGYKGTYWPVIVFWVYSYILRSNSIYRLSAPGHQHTMYMRKAEWFRMDIDCLLGIKLLYADYDFCCYFYIVSYIRGHLHVYVSTDIVWLSKKPFQIPVFLLAVHRTWYFLFHISYSNRLPCYVLGLVCDPSLPDIYLDLPGGWQHRRIWCLVNWQPHFQLQPTYPPLSQGRT